MNSSAKTTRMDFRMAFITVGGIVELWSVECRHSKRRRRTPASPSWDAEVLVDDSRV